MELSIQWSELWQIERVPILAGNFPMVVSALHKMLFMTVFFYVFNYKFLKEKCQKKIRFVIVNLKFLTHLFPTPPFSKPIKHKKTSLFSGVSGGSGRVPCERFKLLNQLRCE